MHNIYLSPHRVTEVKVSVIVCTYSPAMLEHFIECIKSLIDQSHRKKEIICIVDGSKEYYDLIREKYSELFKEDEIRLLLNEKNLGLLQSRNRGAKLSNGDVVAFIDDDAVADKRWIEELVRMYEEHDAIAAGGKLEPLWIAKKPRWLPEEFYWMIGVTHLGFPEKITEIRNTFGSNLSFRKDVFLELGGFNPEMGGIKGSRMLQGGETELCERMRKKFGRGVIYNPDAIVYHKIFERRVKFSYLVKRAFWQGYSKAVMGRVVKNINDEMDFLKFLVSNSLPKRIKELPSEPLNTFIKIVTVMFFTGVVGVGFAFGKIKNVGR